MALKLIGEVGLDGSGFERGLSRLGATAAMNLKNFVIGAFGIYGVQQAIAKTIESADELVVASRRLDLTVEQLQVMRQAALRARIEFSYLEKAIEGINIAREKALSGGKEGVAFLAAFGKAGVSKSMLESQSAASLVTGPLRTATLTHNVQDLEASIRKVTPGFRNFGEILPFLKTDFVALEKEMSGMGAIISGTTANELKLFKDEMGLIGTIITTQLAPVLVAFGEAVMKALNNLKGFGSYAGTVVGNIQSAPGSILYRQQHPEFFDKEGRLNFWRALENEIKNKGTGSALDAFGNSLLSGDAIIEAFHQRIKDLVDRSNNPIPPSKPEEVGKSAKMKAFREKSGDSLVAVGNFLGTSRGGIGGLQEQLVKNTEQTSKNTRDIFHVLSGALIGFSRRGHFGGETNYLGKAIYPGT
jgi:hypothetical protein